MILPYRGLKVFREAKDEPGQFIPAFPQSFAQTFAVGNFRKNVDNFIFQKTNKNLPF